MAFITKRSIRITNFIALIGASLSGLFLLIELVLFWLGKKNVEFSLVVNATLLLLLLGVPILNSKKGNLLASFYLLGIAYIQIIIFSLIGSSRLAVHSWLYIACAGMFLVFDSISRVQRLAIIALSIAIFFFVDIYCTEERALFPLSPNMLLFSRSINLGMLFITLVAVMNIFHKQNHAAQALLSNELKRSDELLFNILPSSIADRLKSGERSIAEFSEDVTVMFADLVGFTPLAASLPPERIIWLLDIIFSTFDEIVHIHAIEKIKTIGDCYMAVGGLPQYFPSHTEAVASAAYDMLFELHRINQITGYPLELRIGMHVGSVVSGVIGSKKFKYDLWGDTVNIASRMESYGEAGRIHCTEEVFQRLNHLYAFEERGEINIKGKGTLKTYFLGIKK